MKIAIIQPSFIPWKGFFDIISNVDIFVHLDDAQYTSHDWRNRNYITGKNGIQLLTVPIKKYKFGSIINEMIIADEISWRTNHLKTIQRNYSKTPYYANYENLINDIFTFDSVSLSAFNINAIEKISNELGYSTKFLKSSDLKIHGFKDQKLIEICKLLGANEYISGPAALNYIQPDLWEKANIKLKFMNYDYPVYPQRCDQFSHNVSIIDLLFNLGVESKNYMIGTTYEYN